MKIINAIKVALTEKIDLTKSRVEVFAIILAGLFAIVQWGLPTYWDRQENYLLKFDFFDANKKSFIGQTFTENYCSLQGTARFQNFSKSPVDIINTYVEFVPFAVKKSCDDASQEECFVSYSGADVYERYCEDQKCETPYDVTVPPIIWEQPLYGKQDATRPFNVSIPISAFDEKTGLLVVATQEIGRGCIASDNKHREFMDVFKECKTTRAITVMTNACQKPSESDTN